MVRKKTRSESRLAKKKCRTHVSLVVADAIDPARLGLERIKVRKGTSSSDESPSESESCSREDRRGEEASRPAGKPASVNRFLMEVSRNVPTAEQH